MSRSRLCSLLALGALSALSTARRADAQAWFYPAFQLPQATEREYNFLAAGGGGSAFVFQWREGIAPGTQLSLDAGLADPRGASNTKLLVGGQYAMELTRATSEQPLDLLLTAGLGLAAGNGPSIVRVPVGVSVGHTFPLEGGLAVTPFVHPRVSFDNYSNGSERTNHLSLDFDVGGSLDITSQMALRAALRFSGNEGASSTGFGVSLAIRPGALKPR